MDSRIYANKSFESVLAYLLRKHGFQSLL